MSPRTRRKLLAEGPARARELAALGLPLTSIAAALGMGRSTLHRWRTEAGPDGPERELWDAIHEGRRQGEATLVARLHKAAAEGDTRAATWLLTHAPHWRESWSDAAAERRSERRILAEVVEAIAAAGLPSDQQTRLLLTMQASGLGIPLDSEELGG